jgi:hypothetical protein
VLLLSIVIDNITETSLLKGTHAFWFLFLLLAVKVPPAIRRRPKQAPLVQDAVPALEESELSLDAPEDAERLSTGNRSHVWIPRTMWLATGSVRP